MKKNDVEIGATFVAKVSGKLARVRIERESSHGGWDAKNIDTGRRVRIRSAARLRRPAKEPHPERDYTTLAEFFPVSMVRPGTAAHQEAAQAAAEQNEDAIGDPDVCATVGCGRQSALTYLGRPLCQECYEDQVADGDLPDRQAGETSEPPNHEEINMTTKTKKPDKKSAAKTTKAGNQPKATKPKAPKPAGDAKPKRLSALNAAAQVLARAGRPMRVKELVAALAEQGLWTSPNGKTPEATLYAAMLREARKRGDVARFRKAERGQFEFNAPGAKE